MLGLGAELFGPGVRAKVAIAAVETRSFQRAERVLAGLSGIAISGRHVGRIARGFGERLVGEQSARTEAFEEGTLDVEVANPPELAVVEIDGGNVNTRAEGHGPGVHEPGWRATKNALFQRMASTEHDVDPCPEPPDWLQNRRRVRQLALEIGGSAEGVEAPEDDESGECSPGYDAPRPLVRTCLASTVDYAEFGRAMAVEAHRRSFDRAPRRAFLGDGYAANWTIWKRRFPTYVPIVDLLHVVAHVYRAAVAVGGDEDFGWGLALEWTRACWQGRVADVAADLEEWLAERPPADEEVAPDDPREIVRRQIGYLRTNAERMQYPEYRRRGLPITTALMESLVKEIHWRVKGTEKFWNLPGGTDPILALQAAALSEDERFEQLLQG